MWDDFLAVEGGRWVGRSLLMVLVSSVLLLRGSRGVPQSWVLGSPSCTAPSSGAALVLLACPVFT